MSVNEAGSTASMHPHLQKVGFLCSCGAKYEIQSTIRRSELNIEVCAQCHPFYTGEQKLIDTAGRVENFRRRYEKKMVAPSKEAAEKESKSDKVAPKKVGAKSKKTAPKEPK